MGAGTNPKSAAAADICTGRVCCIVIVVTYVTLLNFSTYNDEIMLPCHPVIGQSGLLLQPCMQSCQYSIVCQHSPQAPLKTRLTNTSC